MDYNLCLLSGDEQEKIEIDKAAAYAVYKTSIGEIPTPEVDAAHVSPKWKGYFLERCHFYSNLK
jgi:DNA polymerase-3 subunit theta